MMTENINIGDLIKIIQRLQLQVTKNNLLIQKLSLKLEIATAPKERKRREPKGVCSLHPRSHYLIPRDLIAPLLGDWEEIINNIIDNEENCNVASQWERNRSFLKEMFDNLGILVWHYGKGRLSLHRFGGVKFNLSEFGLDENDLKPFNQLRDLEAAHKKEFTLAIGNQRCRNRVAKKEETLSRFTFKDEETKARIMVSHYEEE